jgi:predicted transcriptional regulator
VSKFSKSEDLEVKQMNLSEIKTIIDGAVINEPVNMSSEVKGAYSADLMSDVLAYIQPGSVLITGLCNPQVIRTAQMADIQAVIIVRGKRVPAETIELANKEEIPIILSSFGMYEVCGRLFQAGLPSLESTDR